MPLLGSEARSTQAYSHGRLALLSPAGRTSAKASLPKRSTYRSIFFLRSPRGTALVSPTDTLPESEGVGSLRKFRKHIEAGRLA